MASITYTYTFTGVEPKPGLIYAAPIQNWSGTWNITASMDTVTASEIFNIDYVFRRSGDSTACYSSSTTIHQFSNPYVEFITVGSPAFAWLCGDWDTFELRYGTASDRVPDDRVMTIVFAGPEIEEVIPVSLTSVPYVQIMG